MSSKDQHQTNTTKTASTSPKITPQHIDTLALPELHPTSLIQRAEQAPQTLTPRNVLQLQRTVGNKAVNNILQRNQDQTKQSLSNLSTTPMIQRDYNNENWNINTLLDNIEATSYGQEVVGAFMEKLNELGIADDFDFVSGDRGMAYADGNKFFVMVDKSLSEGDATQQLVQELSNFTIHQQLNRLTGLAKENKIPKEVYVESVERGEYIGASSSREVFLEAQQKKAEWTKKGDSRWGKEADSWETYWENLKTENPGHINELGNRYDKLQEK